MGADRLCRPPLVKSTVTMVPTEQLRDCSYLCRGTLSRLALLGLPSGFGGTHTARTCLSILTPGYLRWVISLLFGFL
jgi:hypothetical protein